MDRRSHRLHLTRCGETCRRERRRCQSLCRRLGSVSRCRTPSCPSQGAMRLMLQLAESHRACWRYVPGRSTAGRERLPFVASAGNIVRNKFILSVTSRETGVAAEEGSHGSKRLVLRIKDDRCASLHRRLTLSRPATAALTPFFVVVFWYLCRFLSLQLTCR